MSLKTLTTEFAQVLQGMKARNRYFFLRTIDPAATPHVYRHGRELIMLGSNNYLGLVNHPKVVEAAVEALREYGTGVCSSRILTGTTSLHTRLERKLAEFKGMEDSVVFTTGFMTMMGTVSALTGPDDVIISDEMNHASIIDGCRLSKAESKVFRHMDMDHLEEILAACHPEVHKLVVTDGVFSMLGTIADLPSIRELTLKYDATLMVDDAHGTGVLGETGRGTLEHYGMEGEVDLICGTFSKAFGSVGGFAAANRAVTDFLRHNSRPFLFSASSPPSVIATVLASLEIMQQEPERLARLRRNTDFLRNGLIDLGFQVMDTLTPIIPIHIGNDEHAFQMVGQLEELGVITNAVVPPAVPSESSLIRVSVMADLSHGDLVRSLELFELVGRKVLVS
ncbi:aminotransferase class I/II-fold pyridoxal phosphate-dependent enzyme [Gemmatimonadota bacterium]